MAFYRKRCDSVAVLQDPWLTIHARDFLGQVCWCLPIRQTFMDVWMKQKFKRWVSLTLACGSANRMQGLKLNAIKTHKWHIIRCSAVTGANLEEGLEWVVQDAKARLFLY